MTRVRPDYDREQYALVGCGSNKIVTSASVPASALYVSTYFDLKRGWADAYTDSWWVLSAKHSAIPSEKPIPTYDATIKELSESELRTFQHQVFLALRCNDARWIGETELVVLAGKKYVDPIRDVLDEIPCDVVYPFEATGGIGEQMGWLSDEIDAPGSSDVLDEYERDEAGEGDDSDREPTESDGETVSQSALDAFGGDSP